MSFRAASREAKKSSFVQHRVGAVIVKGNRILSTGFNKIRPSKELRTTTLHAEAAAILKLIKAKRLHDLSGSDIYVTRFTKGGKVSMAKPCEHCSLLIRSVGIRNVFYTDSTGGTMRYKV